ncbi:hypothetical protein LUCX_163 [Xanthomonas phage vB_XciM_LucasX]|nr:hypothetical protein LUCX_163 [Xanthomonas phage vB_XciM_LucasX]
MSRTTRRNNPYLLDRYIGTRAEFCNDSWQIYKAEKKGLTLEKAYQQRLHWFSRDHRSGRFGVPAWYRRLHGAHLIRRHEAAKLHKHLREDSWEVHQPDSRFRDSMYYWWY